MKYPVSRSAFLTASSMIAFVALSVSANAAKCFDKNTDNPKAGNATAVVGPIVDLRSEDESEFSRPENGADLFSGDHVRTGDASHLQLKLCDWSTYTFSPNSDATINEFYDAAGAGRRRAVNFVRGGFRFASGRDTEPGSTEIELQDTGVTMGVRGTNVILVELDGAVYALLEGPIRENSGLSPRGLVDFWTDDNRNAITASLKRPGFAVRIDDNGVSLPFRADDDLLRRIYQAFVPAVPEGEGSDTDYAGNPVNESGQGAQEGDPASNTSNDLAQNEDEGTDQYPTETPGESEGPIVPPPVVIEVGEILPLDALEDFAAAQTAVDGHIFAIADAQLFVDNGTGAQLEDEGVAIVQLTVDWASRTIAPEALASFVVFDFSVTDASQITPDEDFFFPEEIGKAYLDQMIADGAIPFSVGENDFAVFPTQIYTFTIRQGANDTVTVDVDVDASVTDQQGTTYNGTAMLTDLQVLPGSGDLAYFEFPLASVLTIDDLDMAGMQRGPGAILLRGSGAGMLTTLGVPTVVDGIMAAQIELDYGNRTIGGGDSYIAFTSPASNEIGGATTTNYIGLDQAVSFDTGLFDLAFFPINSLSSDPDVLKGQALVADGEGMGYADIAALLGDSGGNHFYREFELFEAFGLLGSNAVSTIAGLEGQSGLIESAFDVAQGTTFRYEQTQFTGQPGDAIVTLPNGLPIFGTSEISLDINFGNRTIGGGGSFVFVDVEDPLANYSLTLFEGINAISFDDATEGLGVFGLDAEDFAGNNINSMLILLHDGQTVGPGENADIYFDFTDGADGAGEGVIESIPIRAGATPQG
ncbi:FecR domain-containing protein [Hyphococcus sp. DH-69]|uniref:FecR domain-containing protein n=1 Tax=Hyphococcus formosus TaxID=3143534 RepID=UPI00398AA7D9